MGENRLLRTQVEIYRVVGAPPVSGMVNKIFYRTLALKINDQPRDINRGLNLLPPFGGGLKTLTYDSFSLAIIELYDKFRTCQEHFSMFFFFIDIQYADGIPYTEFRSTKSHANLVIFEKNQFGCEYTVKRHDTSSKTVEDQNIMDAYVSLLLEQLKSRYERDRVEMPPVTLTPSRDWSLLKIQQDLKQCFKFSIDAYKKFLHEGRGSISRSYLEQLKSEVNKGKRREREGGGNPDEEEKKDDCDFSGLFNPTKRVKRQ